jgi:hypothetical protein
LSAAYEGPTNNSRGWRLEGSAYQSAWPAAIGRVEELFGAVLGTVQYSWVRAGLPVVAGAN